MQDQMLMEGSRVGRRFDYKLRDFFLSTVELVESCHHTKRSEAFFVFEQEGQCCMVLVGFWCLRNARFVA